MNISCIVSLNVNVLRDLLAIKHTSYDIDTSEAVKDIHS